jgi:nitrate reductase assembly molybdenum cofactor insertion protein NarJ
MKRRSLALVRDAAEWRLVSLLFECPGEAWLEQVTELAAEVRDPVLRSAAAAAGEATASLYHTTFGPGGPAAPREVSYQPTLMPGRLLGELQAFYQAFAYTPSVPEAPDHVAVETGFVSYLCLKQAYALERGQAEQAATAAAAVRRFVAEHLSLVAEALAQSLADSDVRYLAQAAACLRQRACPAPAAA